MSDLWKNIQMKNGLFLSSPFEVWLIINKVHLMKWEYDVCEASGSKIKASESVFQTLNQKISLSRVKPSTFWKQLPFMKNDWWEKCVSSVK